MEYIKLVEQAEREIKSYIENEGAPLLVPDIDIILSGLLVEQLEEILNYESVVIGGYVKAYFKMIHRVMNEHYDDFN